MKELEEKIIKEGKVLDGDILKIDNFLNHQIDVDFLCKIGEEFYNLFKDEKVTKILTIESSGIGMAIVTAQYFNNCPVVFAKKAPASTQDDSVYSSKVYSYTRQREYNASVNKRFLNEDDTVLIIDDFFANGEALNALIDICKQSGCKLVGCGICVEKTYQKGPERIKKLGVRVESLAKVKYMEKDHIEFMD